MFANLLLLDNARIMDFSDVSHWENNKLPRTGNSRMGWSDVALCAKGPIVEDLKAHFVQRWNFMYEPLPILDGTPCISGDLPYLRPMLTI